MGFGLKLAPGIRISASSRGIRAGVGPRAARAHVGSGGVGLSSGIGPLSLFTGTGSRGGSRAQSTSTAGGNSRRDQEIAAVIEADKRLVRWMNLHVEDFPSPTRPIAPTPPLEKKARRKARSGALTAPFKLTAAQRAASAAEAKAVLHQAIRDQTKTRLREQSVLDKEWNRFVSNDPDLVLPRLEAAFEDNDAPAAAVGCEAATAYVVVRWWPLSQLVADRKFARTPSGRPTHHKRSIKERNSCYLTALSSCVLATAKETLAVAPGLDEVSIVAVRGDRDSKRGGTYLSAIAAATVRRKDVSGVAWPTIQPNILLRSLRGTRMMVRERTREIERLPVEHDPNFATGLGAVAEGYGWKLHDPVIGGRFGAWATRAAFALSDTGEDQGRK